jgi:dTMP kinase
MGAPGVLITFEGGEGTGKSTQAGLLATRLSEAGLEVHPFREPGGTELGDEIRRLLLDPEMQPPFARAELLLYEASRAQLVEREILPRLGAGDIVILDRFTDSTLAYQAWGRGLDEAAVRSFNDYATHGCSPDLTILLDAEVDLGMARATLGGADRLELELDEFHMKVREGFRAIAAAEPERVKLIAADAPRGTVATAVWEHVERLLAARGLVA